MTNHSRHKRISLTLKYFCFLFLAFWLLCSGAWAQTTTTFPLKSKGSHIFFTAQVDGKPFDIMIESGLPAFLVGQEFYEGHLKGAGLAFEASKAEIRLFHDVYKILFRANGKIEVGDACYEGPIFVLQDFEDLRMPIQFMESTTGKAIVKIDLGEGYMSVGEAGKSEDAHYRKYKISYNQMGMPIVNTSLRLKTVDGKAKLKGDFVLDFGNPMLLFLMRQHKILDRAVKKGGITLKDAYDANGVLVSQGLFAVQACLCGRKYENVSIGVTDKMQTFEELGLIGIPFFNAPVVFDFDKNIMMIEK